MTQMSIARDAIIENMNVGMMVMDAANRLVDVNPAALRLLERKPEDVIQQTPQQIFYNHPEVLQLFQDLTPYSDSTITTESALGTDFFVELTLSPLFDNADQPSGSLIMLQDITARKQAQIVAARRMAEVAALNHVDEQISSTLEMEELLEIALSSALLTSNADAGFISLIEHDTHRIVQIAGDYPPGLLSQPRLLDRGIIGQVARDLQAKRVTAADNDPEFLPSLPGSQSQMTIPLISHDNLIGILNLEATNEHHFKPEMFEFSQSLASRIAIALENAQLYSASQKHVLELQQLEQEKTNLIRIAAHDLRNPVTTVLGYLDLLLIDQERMEPEHQTWIITMFDLTQRIDKIITDVLAVERVQQGQKQEIFDLIEMAAIVIDAHQTDIREKGLVLTTHFPILPINLEGDSVQMREAMVNLINNAIKYTPSGGSIDISLETTGEHALFRVTDTGYGIQENLQKDLFQPFYRAVSEETSSIDGTGLGLHLVKNIIERHGGEMQFESVYGEGSMFGFALPLPAAD